MPRREAAFFLFFPLLAFLLLWEVLVGGSVLLPAEYLRGMSPWGSAFPPAAGVELPQWNALQWDGMAEFYPWRLHAAREMTAGRIPLWNPFVLSGTPFLANSQSAPLYPLHLLYYLPLGASIAVRMGWLAFLHLSLAGAFTYLLARAWGARPLAAAVGGAAFELSGFAVAWLELPSFISVGCWIPLLLLCLGRALREGSWRWAGGAGAVAGTMLLAGHLQIAFYGLLAAGVVWVWETVGAVRGPGGRGQGDLSPQPPSLQRRGGLTSEAAASEGLRSEAIVLEVSLPSPEGEGSGERTEEAAPTHLHPHPYTPTHRVLLTCALVGAFTLLIAFCLAAPQVLPSVELSRMSHRAGAATTGGYAEYVKLALGPRNWITLLVPDYYGLPGLGFWGGWNYGTPNVMEYAGHVGVAAFVLALVGLVWGWRADRRAFLPTLLTLLALLVAAGSPVAAFFYFVIPGFSQSGSPGRSLVLFCLGQAVLAAFGAEWLLRRAEGRWTAPLREAGIAFLAAAGVMLALHGLAMASLPPGNWDEPIARTTIPALVTSLLYAAGLVFLLGLMSWLLRENSLTQRLGALGVTATTVVAGGLLYVSGPYNLTAPRELAYPEMPLMDALRQSGARAATLNRGWSLERVPPALLPPNASLAYGWRDAQGYDSLYLGHYRRLANALAAPGDASPPENGNIVFIKQAGSPLFPLLGARYVVSQVPLQRDGLLPAAGFPPGPPFVYQDLFALPEAYTVPAYQVAPDAEALERLSQLGPKGLRETAMLAPLPDLPSAVGMEPGRGGEAEIARLAPGRIRVRTSAETTAPLLVLSEGYAPGWRATVRPEGAAAYPARVLRTDVAFQGVLVPPGPVTVEWRYLPASFRAGLFLALLALTMLLALIVSRRPERASDYMISINSPTRE